jgi:hypothetical protein
VPDPGDAAAAGVYADLETSPFKWMIDQAAKKGEKVTIGGKVYDFTGLGEAEYQRKYSDAMAGLMLDLQKEYGPQVIDQRLKELEAADPAAFAQRKATFQNILADLDASPDRPTAERLQEQILAELNKGGDLDPQMQNEILQSVRGGQAARGIVLGNAPAAQEAQTLTNASENMRAKRQQDAITFLTTGVAPEDVQYRREQQGLANLGAFQSGETPVAQFGQLSAAQTGVVPFYQVPSTQITDPNAASKGMNYASNQYAGTSDAWQNTVNPWIAGLSSAAGAMGAWSSLGGSFYGGGGGGGGGS